MRVTPTTPDDRDPAVPDAPHNLDLRARTLWVLTGVAGTLVLGTAGAIALGIYGGPWWLVLSLLPLLLVTDVVYTRLHWARWWWGTGREGLELGHGVIIRKASYVPYHRIQQIDVERGPFDRLLGLAQVKVHTASATTDASIPGLAVDDAQALRRHLLEQASIDDGV